MIELRKRGMSSALICSDAFLRLGKAQARVLGAADLPLIVIAHPLGGLAYADVTVRADTAMRQLVDLLHGLTR